MTPGMIQPRGSRRPALGAAIAVAVAVIAGCGDDGGATPASTAAKPTAAATPGAAVGPPGASKTPLDIKPRIEDRVACPIPEQPSDPKDGKCDPKAPSCPEHTYCLPLAQGTYCEACPERDGIRHAFRDRDFDPEHNRDPFQSFLTPLGPTKSGTPGLTPTCPREDQLVASNYSYSDLKLVGIVSQGTQRKVLMMGGPLGYIIKRGDCVGKEKAVVKEIGLGYVTFAVEPEDFSVQLNPKQLMVNEPELPSAAPRTTITPVVAPPAVLPSRGAGAGSAAAPAEAPPAGAAAAAAAAAAGARPGAPAAGAVPAAAGAGAPAVAAPAGAAAAAPAAAPPTVISPSPPVVISPSPAVKKP